MPHVSLCVHEFECNMFCFDSSYETFGGLMQISMIILMQIKKVAILQMIITVILFVIIVIIVYLF